MEVFLLVRRNKTTIFLDVKEDATVADIKLMIEGILKVKPCDQQLLTMENKIMQDENALMFYGISSTTTLPHIPVEVVLQCKTENGTFEPVEIASLSKPQSILDTTKK